MVMRGSPEIMATLPFQGIAAGLHYPCSPISSMGTGQAFPSLASLTVRLEPCSAATSCAQMRCVQAPSGQTPCPLSSICPAEGTGVTHKLELL